MVPPNLVHVIEGVGLDYGLSAREAARRVVNGWSAPVAQPTAIEAPYGLVPVERDQPPVVTQLTGRQLLWEVEVELGSGAPRVRRTIPAPEAE